MGFLVKGEGDYLQHHQNPKNEGGASEACLPSVYLFGDVLEAVVSHVPTVDLLPVSRVSREWRCAVRYALRRCPRRRPWLIVHLQSSRRSRMITTHAYDPHSRTWLRIPHHAPLHLLPRGCEGGRLYALSLARLAVSADPFGATWREIDAPRVWRENPVVAVVGRRVAVIGGACELALRVGEEVGAVEVHDRNGWEACEAMPAAFNGSASAMWLSVAASEQRVYVVERKSGWASWFNPEDGRWGPTRQLLLDTSISDWAIGLGWSSDRLVLVGAGDGRGGVRVWEVEGETLQVLDDDEGQVMPMEMAERLFPLLSPGEERDFSCSIGLCSGGLHGGYVYNKSEPKNGMVLYEFDQTKTNKNRIRWEWVTYDPPAPVLNSIDRLIFACSSVGLDDLVGLPPSTISK